MKIKFLMALLLTVLIIGCTAKPSLYSPFLKLNQPTRIISHDFSKKYNLVPNNNYQRGTVNELGYLQDRNKINQDSIEVNSNNLKQANNNPQLQYVDVEFYNESSIIKDTTVTVDNILKKLDGNKYLIVGHSHGNSLVGVGKLATERAKFVSEILQASGVPRANIYHISSWSDTSTDYDMKKGVRVFSMPEKLSLNESLITGLTFNAK